MTVRDLRCNAPPCRAAHRRPRLPTPAHLCSASRTQSATSDWGRNGIGMVLRQTADPQISAQDPTFETRVSFDYAYTGSSWTNSYGGLVAYDLQSGRPRWLLTWWVYCYQMNYQWNQLQVRYPYRYSWQSYHQIFWWSSLTLSANLDSWPVDLLLMRGSASRTWTFYHKYWSDINYTPSFSGSIFYDTNSQGITIDPTQMRVGMWAQQEASFTSRVLFDRFIVANSSSLAARSAFNGYWVARNQTLRTSGICAVARAVERIVPATQASYLARDLVGNEGYR